MRVTAGAACACLFFSASAAVAGVPRREMRLYAAGAGDLTIACVAHNDQPVANVGGACFEVDGDEVTVTVTIEDASGLPVGALYQFVDSDSGGNEIESATFCAGASVSVPADARQLFIYVHEIRGPFDCDGAIGSGTAGKITARFD